MNITILIPAYNEEKGISKTIEDIKKAIRDLKHNFEIMVVNDGSTDKTSKIISNIKGIKLINSPVNRGYGASLKTGIKNSKSDYILIIDSDGTYPPSAIPALVKHIGNFDMVVGARTGKVVKIPLLRKPAKLFITKFAEYLAGKKIPDLNSGLRIFKKSIALRFMNLFPDGFSFTSTITLACLTNDYTVKYIPINYYKRKGKSSIHPIKDFIGFTNLITRLTVYFRPMHVFMPISIFIFLLGLAKLIRDFVLLGSFGLGGAIAILAAVQIAFLGIVAELIIKRTSI